MISFGFNALWVLGINRMIGYVRKFDLGDYRFAGIKPYLCRIVGRKPLVCQIINRNDEIMLFDVIMV